MLTLRCKNLLTRVCKKLLTIRCKNILPNNVKKCLTFAKTGITVTGRKLRHYFATERWKGGWGIEMISRALGHRNLDVTRRYIDMDQEVLAEATENLFQSNGMYATIAGKLL